MPTPLRDNDNDDDDVGYKFTCRMSIFKWNKKELYAVE